MKQKLRVFLTLLLCAVASVGWSEEITYTFQSKSWTAVLGSSTTFANWNSGKDGSGFTASQGVQVTTSTSGANATSPDSYANISKIVVVYNTNKTAGKGAIKIQVDSYMFNKFYLCSSNYNYLQRRRFRRDCSYSNILSCSRHIYRSTECDT